MDLRQVEYFLAVVDHGGVTRAAEALHVAQPSLSQAIRALERDLGVELFHRVGRGLELSPAGRALLGPARQVAGDMAAARRAVAEVAALTAGRLDLVAHAALAVDPVCAAIGAFRRRFPGVSVHVTEPRNDEELARLIRDGRHEVGFTYLPAPDTGLRTRELGTHELSLALPPGTPVDDDPLPLAAVAEHPIVGILRGSSLRTAVTSALRRAGVRYRVAVTTAHRESVVPLVLAGAGAAFLTRAYAEEAARLGAVVRRLDPPITCRFGALHRPGPLSPAARAFLAMVTAVAAGRPAPPASQAASRPVGRPRD